MTYYFLLLLHSTSLQNLKVKSPVLEVIACQTDAHRAPMSRESRDGTSEGTWELYSEFSSLSPLTSQANIAPENCSACLAFTPLNCLAVERSCWVGLHYRTQVCAMELRSHPIIGIFFSFFFLSSRLWPLTYLWQLQCRRYVKINNAHINGLLWNWNLFKLIEHAGIWYIEHLAIKPTFMRVYNGILDLNDHLSARKGR